eukprot:1139197-Pelagomonas_calceolata.AAC.10
MALPTMIIPAPLGSTRFFRSMTGWYTLAYNFFAVLNLATAIHVSPGLPICNFELEVLIGLTRRGSYA